MGKISWKITAAVGFVVFSQTASAAPNSPVAMVASDSAYQDSAYQGVPQPEDPKSIGRLAQAEAPAAPATTAPPDSKGPQDPSPPAIASSPNPTSKAVVMKAGPTVVGCGLKYLSAELAGKLKGRKWKQFSQEECGPISTQAVFPSTIAPKYSAEHPDKARTLTCADQFNANKATNANDGLKWIEKGGGYYSECVSRLKG
jgi:hypothetical protein